MDSKQRVIVITGANKGIGFELAKRLLKNPSKPRLVLTSRNESLGREALRELSNLSPSSKDDLHYHVLDITKKETYASFADWIKATFGKIDVLVNNAGVATGNEFSPDYKTNLSEASFIIGTNYIATKEFTEYVLPLLSSDGKIINVSSTLGEYKLQGSTLHKKLTNPEFKPEDIEEIYNLFVDTVKKQNFEEAGITVHPYLVSKALLNAWTYHVLRKQVAEGQQVYSMCPGWCRTDMGGPTADKSPEEGPETIEYLIDLPYKVDPELNGKFFKDNKVVDL